jgi:hypothetical protein
MSWRYMVGLLCISLGSLAYSAEEEDEHVDLPQWSESAEQVQGGLNTEPIGGLLWPSMQGIVIDGEEVGDYPVVADNGENQQPSVDISGFLPPKLIASKNSKSVDAAGPKLLVQVDQQYLLDCAAVPVDQHLIDPWHYLGEMNGEELERFLAYHSEHSSIKAYVLVLDKGEQLPKDVKLQTLASGALTKGRSCLAVVPVGEPWRARIFLSQDVQSAVPPVYLANLAGDCVGDAALVADEAEQLHRFLVRLSTRLFWLERLLPGHKPAPSVKSEPVAKPVQTHEPQSYAAGALTEVLDEPQPSLQQKLAPLLNYWPWLAAVAGLGLLGWGLLRRRRYLLRHYEWILPEPAAQSTLCGTKHVGMVVSMDYRLAE